MYKEDILTAVKKPPSNKAYIANVIPAKIIKSFANCYCEKLKDIFNKCLQENKFSYLMKKNEIITVFKKLDHASKDNYRPISCLSNFTKIFKSIFSVQLNDYMENKFSKYLTGFRKNHNTQHSLLRTI